MILWCIVCSSSSCAQTEMLAGELRRNASSFLKRVSRENARRKTNGQDTCRVEADESVAVPSGRSQPGASCVADGPGGQDPWYEDHARARRPRSEEHTSELE